MNYDYELTRNLFRVVGYRQATGEKPRKVATRGLPSSVRVAMSKIIRVTKEMDLPNLDPEKETTRELPPHFINRRSKPLPTEILSQ